MVRALNVFIAIRPLAMPKISKNVVLDELIESEDHDVHSSHDVHCSAGLSLVDGVSDGNV